MEARKKYSEVRQGVIQMLRTDLLGPMESEEVVRENPRYAYKVGMLAPQTSLDDDRETSQSDQEIDADVDYADGEDYSADGEDDNEPVSASRFKLPSSIGISFYVEKSLPGINLDVSWGDYVKTDEPDLELPEKNSRSNCFRRYPRNDTVKVNFSEFDRYKDYSLDIDPSVQVHVSRIPLKNEYALVSAYVINRRDIPESEIGSLMFQVKIRACSSDHEKVFFAENICREVLEADEFYYEQRPIIGHGRGCAATWGNVIDGRTEWVESEFIPEYEIPGVSAALEGFDKFYFSMRDLSRIKEKEESISRLKVLADSYEQWIRDNLENNPRMQKPGFKEKIGDAIIGKCRDALNRIRQGIDLLSANDTAFEAFCFMNRAMILQRNILSFSHKYGSGTECSFADFVSPKEENNFGWRPFQIAFILLNLNAIVDPLHKDHEVVDLLYFPTGGGKTEAYLGLMAFTIANRRLSNRESDKYNRDGGVTAILRYTLRLLTTQQRDRITKMVVAAEMIRRKDYPKFGKEPITIGFWVGGGVTPNKFDLLKTDPEDAAKSEEAKKQRRLLYRQLLNCPFCGKPLNKDDFYIEPAEKAVRIYCHDPHCIFYKYREKGKMQIPVYLVDEEIYARCPTIVLSTVDKFAALPWTTDTNALFGRVDRVCSRDGYVAIGSGHSRHRKTNNLPASELSPVRPFLPPELIIQDELHLITGPLGTIYGAYETLIENLCTYEENGKTIRPKYVVSTATIKNAGAQALALYGRRNTKTFPPSGFEIGSSFFITEIPIDKDPFRKYVGVCAPGQSVKNALLYIYAAILQKTYDLSLNPESKQFIDPYYSLVGYFNSIRELGGAVRLLQDDIPDRMKRIRKKYGMAKQRYLNNRTEITSRMSSAEIPDKLKKLETPCGEKECLDTAVATNMIAVGMDVDRLGLMVVTGQPKQNSEYIQATSRIGRSYPGLVVTLYNPYRPRDLSHYENFIGYHSQLYRFVEGTTATPFSERARDRVMHALIIAAVRLRYPEMADNDDAANIGDLSPAQLAEVKNLIMDRLKIVKPAARAEAEGEFDLFVNQWKQLASQSQTKPLRYYVVNAEKYNRLMNDYGEECGETEKATLRSMRDVEKTATLYYYTEE